MAPPAAYRGSRLAGMLTQQIIQQNLRAKEPLKTRPGGGGRKHASVSERQGLGLAFQLGIRSRLCNPRQMSSPLRPYFSICRLIVFYLQVDSNNSSLTSLFLRLGVGWRGCITSTRHTKISSRSNQQKERKQTSTSHPGNRRGKPSFCSSQKADTPNFCRSLPTPPMVPKPCSEQASLGIFPSLMMVASGSDLQDPGETAPPPPKVSGFGFLMSLDGNTRLPVLQVAMASRRGIAHSNWGMAVKTGPFVLKAKLGT